MKKLLNLAACVLLSLTACQKEMMNPVNEGSDQRTEFAVVANLDTFESDAEMPSSDLGSSMDTKAAANAVIRLNWAAGDKISAVNLSTGKALGGDLVAQEDGSSSLFSGTLIGTINRGDRIAFLYPSQGYTEEQAFSGATIDLSRQGGTSAVPLAVYGTATMSGNQAQNLSIDFKYLMSYYQINLTDLPASSGIESVRFPGMGSETTLTINGTKDGFVSTAKDGDIKVKSSSLRTNDRGVKAVYISGFASTSKPSRNVEVMMDGFGYSTTWSGATLNVGRYYAAVVTDFKDEVAFEDANFEAYCLEKFDTNHDGKISKAEAFTVTEMSFNSDNIESVVGIRSFKNLRNLTIWGSAAKWSRDGKSIWSGIGDYQVYKALPVLKGTSASGKIRSLDLSGMSHLGYLDVLSDMLEEINLDGCEELYDVSFKFTCLSTLDVSNNTALRYLKCSYTQLPSLDLSKNTALTDLFCSYNQLPSLDLSKNTALTSLSCNDNQLTSLDLSKNTALTTLWCRSNQLTSLDLSKSTALTTLYCYDNQLTSLDLSNNSALTGLYCYNNLLTSLDLSKNTALRYLGCYSNQLTSLDVSNNTALTELYCYINQLTSLDVSNNTSLTDLSCFGNQLTSLDVSRNTALRELSCGNNQLTSLDVSNNTALTYLSCFGNQLTSLDVSRNTALTSLECGGNQLTSLDLSNNSSLTYLSCSGNQLTMLDVSRTNLGNSPYGSPLSCAPMPSLQTLRLHTGWQINGINVERSTDYIPAGTTIIYDNTTTDTPPIEEL